MLLRARQFSYTFPRPALIMGILNVTPDSFSDGGAYVKLEEAVAHAEKMAAQGADMIDVGGESTRPRAVPVPESEELRRVIPVIRELAGRLKVPISIDTMKPAVAAAALEAGASVVNDVAANRADERMWRVAGEAGAAYVCMHMQGTPQTMQEHPQYADVVREVAEFFLNRLERLRDCGMAPEQIILDPGIGFGKTVEHNLELLGGLRRFTEYGRPLLLGVSRKSFLSKLPGGDAAGRLPGALACAVLAVQAGVSLLRVHDVPETVQAVRMAEAILSGKRV